MASDKPKYCREYCRPSFAQAQPPCDKCDYAQPKLLPGNYEAWELWNAVTTQWRVGSMGILLGLDYTAMFAVADILGIDMTPAILTKIRVLESKVIADRNKSMAEEGEK